MNRTIREVITNTIFEINSKIDLIKENHNRLLYLFNEFNVNENNDLKRNLVIDAIKNDDWEISNPNSFKKSLNKSKTY